MSTSNVTMRTYKDQGAFARGVQDLSRDGWAVVSVAEHIRRPMLAWGPLSRLLPATNRILVTYCRRNVLSPETESLDPPRSSP